MTKNLELTDVVTLENGDKRVTIHLSAEQSKELLQFALMFLMAQGALSLKELPSDNKYSLETMTMGGTA